jgi:hypothetical protein
MKATSNAGVLVTRRRLLAGTAALPLVALAVTFGLSIRARAATDTIPSAVRDLDVAAMALFDAAEGQLNNFFQARNNLTGDLIEAKTALSVKDRRWLVSSADRIAARAGELAQPFAQQANVLIARIEALLSPVRAPI